jgi:putative chitinase
MNFDRKKLFDGLRKRFGKLDHVQGLVIGSMVAEFERRKLSDVRWLAYMLATGWGESQWRPVREGFKATDAEARKHVAMLKRKGVIKTDYAKPDPVTGKSYYGRGCPTQITHKVNYEINGQRLNLPLVTDPDLALQVPVGVAIGFEGMIHGLFTGKKLADYFSATRNDPVNARRIINGTNKAQTFAKWHYQILEVLEAARLIEPVKAQEFDDPRAPKDEPPAEVATDKGKPQGEPSGGVGGVAGGVVAGGVGTGAAAAVVAGYDWKLVALVAGCAVAAGVIAWIVFKKK